MVKIAKLFQALLLLIVFSLFLEGANHLKSIKINKGELRLIFENKIYKSNVSTFVLDKPYRRVFDFKNTIINNDDLLDKLHAPNNTTFRLSQFTKDTVRLVIEATRPFKCSYYAPMLDSNIYHISLPYSIGYKEVNPYKAPPKTVTKPKVVEKPKYAANDEDVEVEKLPWYKRLLEGNKRDDTVYKPSKRYRVVIDAGHGGHDPGAVSGGYREKDVVLKVANKVQRILERQGYKVYMTRTSDYFVTLGNRTRFSNKRDADIFISIHANAVGKKSRANIVQGVETYFLSKARSERARRVAAKENRAVLDTKDYHTRNVLLNDIITGPKIILSHKLAIDVQNSILEYTRSLYPATRNGGVKSAPFWVLVGAQTPSILIEIGYITHPFERQKLLQSSYQTMIAKGIAKGIGRYLKNREKELN
ncbi:MAG: N-acetylmuramoyl-L-alanine amidase [Campylobacterales bacterium]|nr:N-acetylmuramoyl-L-alanine amidase [Campylobacterales bacterium]